MKVLAAIILIAVATSVYAQPDEAYGVHPRIHDRAQVFEDPSPGDPWYARVDIINLRGSYNKTEVEETSLGQVSVEYKTSQPSIVGDPNSNDAACVIALPDGVVAVPVCVEISEQTTENIYLHIYIGG